MLKGFKDFLMRGNVIDLATAVVVGAAFTAIVTAFTTNIIEPLINSIGGTDQAEGLGFTIRSGNPETFVNIGALITAIINFLIIAAIVYFVIVMPYEKLKALAAKDGDDATALSESELLTEIRDILQGKDPVEEKAKIAAAKSEKDQAEIDRRRDEGPPSGPLYSGPIPGGTVGASAAGTQQFSSQPSGPIGGANPYPPQGPPTGGSGPIGQPNQGPPPQGGAPQSQSPLGGPPPGYQQPSGPPPGYNPAPPQRPNPPQYGGPEQGAGYRPDPLTGPPPNYDPLTGPPPNYGPPPGRPDESNGGGRHSSP